MNAMPPSAAPPPPPAPVQRFALAITPESLQQRWHAVLRPEAGDGLTHEFTHPLDLLRHLARPGPPPADAGATPLPRTGPSGLR